MTFVGFRAEGLCWGSLSRCWFLGCVHCCLLMVQWEGVGSTQGACTRLPFRPGLCLVSAAPPRATAAGSVPEHPLPSFQEVPVLLGLELVLWQSWALSGASPGCSGSGAVSPGLESLSCAASASRCQECGLVLLGCCESRWGRGEGSALHLASPVPAVLPRGYCIGAHHWQQDGAQQLSSCPGAALPAALSLSPQDYCHQLRCTTETEEFTVPIRGIGAQAVLDLPQQVDFSTCPVKHSSQRTLLLRNVGEREAQYCISTQR